MFDWIFEFRDDIRGGAVDFLRSMGVNPVYASTLICILITSSYWRQFKNWNKQDEATQFYLKSGIFLTIVLVIISIINFFTGILD